MPLIIIVLAFQEADKPGGRFDTDPIPVAPVVVMLMGVTRTPTHTGGMTAGTFTVLRGLMVIGICTAADAQDPEGVNV